ncbi:MAG TPA: phosphoribosylaminoimidazolesuccinocarboxamide synthase [Paenalcaligenes sp.]|nr:phosphoribosylaminoimidazolesuccinocarboxamide synthase [Paenalcaligenes sp.]
MQQGLYESTLQSLPLVHRGKVRDMYAVDEQWLLIVTTDRISAFDVVLGEPIPGKGQVLTQLTEFWLQQLQDLIPNHATGIDPVTVVRPDEQSQVAGRGMVVKRLKPILFEAVVRGYLVGSGWADYQNTGSVCGIQLPTGLALAQALPEPIFTPAAKAEVGDHDENVSFDRMIEALGKERAMEIRDVSLRLYQAAARYARSKGLIIADTKFEFGVDEHGQLHLMDEVLTPDSSRFWLADTYAVGANPPSFDKQYLRDWLQAQPWDKTAPAPRVPAEIIEETASKYKEALHRLTQE